MHLKLLILKLLKEGEKTGYDLIKTIEKESGWKPSPGSIYPHLNDLKNKKHIKVKEEGRRKIYTITNEGKTELKKMSSEIVDILDNVSKRVSVFENFFGIKLDGASKLFPFIIGELKQGRIPFGQLGKDTVKFRLLFLKKAMDEKNHSKMKKILNEAYGKLEEI